MRLKLLAALLLATLFAVTPAHAETARQSQWWLTDQKITGLHASVTGSGVVIAVIDTGVDPTVPELKGALVDGADFTGRGKPNGQQPVGEPAFQGTAVAGLIAGRGNTGGARDTAGILGVAPQAKIMPISVDAESVNGQLPDAIRYAVDKGAKVIALTYYFGPVDPTPTEAEEWATAAGYAYQKGVVIVGGWYPSPLGYPNSQRATLPNMLVVNATYRTNDPIVSPPAGTLTALGAPGATDPKRGLISTLPMTNASGTVGHYGLVSGQPYAVAYTAGVLALTAQKYPRLNVDNLINRLTATSRGSGKLGNATGFGSINPVAAVNSEVTQVPANPVSSQLPTVPTPDVSNGVTYRPSPPPATVTVVSEVPVPTAAAAPTDSSPAGLIVVLACLTVLAVVALVWWLLRRRANRQLGRDIRARLQPKPVTPQITEYAPQDDDEVFPLEDEVDEPGPYELPSKPSPVKPDVLDVDEDITIDIPDYESEYSDPPRR